LDESGKEVSVRPRALTGGRSGNSIALRAHGTQALKLSGETLTGGKDGDARPALTVQAADGPGTHANGRVVRIGEAGNGKSDHFALTVLRGDEVLDHFDNLSLEPADPDFAHTRVNGRGARLIETRTHGTGASERDLPCLGDHALTGGDDGLKGLTDTDFIGDETAGTGMYGWKSIEGRFALASIPDRPTPAVQRAALLLCEKQRHFFHITDLPAHLQWQEAISLKFKHCLHNNRASTFYTAIDPESTSTLKGERSNSAGMAGAMARTDVLKGVAKVAAGIEDGRLFGVTGLVNDATQQQSVRDALYQAGINPLWVKPGVGVFNDGALLSQPNGSVRFINQRRVLIYIESSLKEGMRFVLHENICERLYHRVNATITTFLTRVWQQGGLRGNTADEAFFVDTSHGPGTLNPPESEDEGRVNVRVGLATLKPAQFVNITLTLAQPGTVAVK
ncbi:MAG: hypothetical protein AAF471_02505, partial [Myxococcota bacterium]